MYNTRFGNPTKSVNVTACSNKVEQGAFFSVAGGYMEAGEWSKPTTQPSGAERLWYCLAVDFVLTPYRHCSRL